jgi:phospholipid-transporting ATPase
MSGGKPNILLPLCIVIGVSAIKDLIEDYKRRKSDNEENSRIVYKVENGGIKKIKWEEVETGDILKV